MRNRQYSRERLGKMRNLPCRCFSGKKYKVCHMAEDEGFVKDTDGLNVISWLKDGTKYETQKYRGSLIFMKAKEEDVKTVDAK